MIEIHHCRIMYILINVKCHRNQYVIFIGYTLQV